MDSKRSHQHITQSISEEASGYMNQQTAKFDRCDVDLPSISGENNELMSCTDLDMDYKEYMDEANLPKGSKRNDEKIVSRPEECNAESPQCKAEENEVQRCLQNLQIYEPQRCVVPQKDCNGDNQKRDFVGSERVEPREYCVIPPQQLMDECGSTGLYKDTDETRPPQQFNEESDNKKESNSSQKKLGKYFYYDSPLYEETGVWIPVSVPPLSEKEHEDWARGFHPSGDFFPEEHFGWSQCTEEDRELTMWDVVVDMLNVARGKVTALAAGDVGRISWISTHLMEQTWKEMAETLMEANFNNTIEIVEAEPPKWLPDSAASACMLCGVQFHPIMCTRHHCRFCGGIFCGECSRGRSLLPAKFYTCDPERVCDVCCVRLESVQLYLMDRVSRAAQLPTHDVTDLSTLRSWLNFPWGQSMEYEIYKATNTFRAYIGKVLSLKTEKAIPNAILRQAKGLAVITVMKVGMMVTYNIGTGLVVVRKDDGLWSAPSAISSFGLGWGAQVGGELIDLIIVLRTNDAVRTFSGDVHLSLGAGLGAAVGIVGRTAEAGIRAGGGGCAACYTYSCSKGAFVGCSLEGSIVTTRTRENTRFYGSQSLNASEILLGSLPRPPAASILYHAIEDLYQKLGR